MRSNLLGTILPSGLSLCELAGGAEPDPLYPEEELLIYGAVPKRRREFALSRTCTRRALAGLGIEAFPVLSAPNRAPLWPSGVVGSITHCDLYTAAVVGLDTHLRSIGIDAEVNQPLPEGTYDLIALPRERTAAKEFLDPRVCWDRLLFSAKESIFKAWSPLSVGWLDFQQVEVSIDPTHLKFHAKLLIDSPATGEFLEGKFRLSGKHIFTVVAIQS